jgi:hypothetical protein
MNKECKEEKKMGKEGNARERENKEKSRERK